MAINMNALPNDKPSMGKIYSKGTYKATIKEAKMATPKNGGKDYFSAECDIFDKDSGVKLGKFWIRLFDSEAALCQWQAGRFIKALGLNLTGEVELKDLTKLCNGKSLLVDLCPEDKPDPQQSIVDISADCYYPLESAPADTMEAAEADIPFANAQTPSDAAPVLASY